MDWKEYKKSSVLLVIVMTSIFVSLTSTAWAQSFEELIEKARVAYEAEDYNEAVDFLIQANRVQPNPRLLLNIARSFERGGHCEKALVYYRAFIRDPEAEPELLDQAQGQLDEASECGRWNDDMAGRLTFTSVPAGAAVFVDSEKVGTTPAEVAGIRSGERLVRLELEGYTIKEERVTLRRDTDLRREFTLQVYVEPTEPDDDDGIVIREKDDSNLVPYIAAGAITAVGAGLLIMGIVTDMVSIPNLDEERSQYQPGSAEFVALTEDREGLATRALVGYVGGGVLIVGGAGWLTYLLLTSDSTEEPSVEDRFGFHPTFGPDGAGIQIRGSF